MKRYFRNHSQGLSAWPASFLPRLKRAIARRLRYRRYLLNARQSSLQNLSGKKRGSILVLCYGNIYRSPFVAAKLKTLLCTKKWSVNSAGFYDKQGRPCDIRLIALARQYGIDLTEHRSRRVTSEELDSADIVVIMDCMNRDLLEDYESSLEKKIVWIGACLESGRPDVVDPYGRTANETRLIIRHLNTATQKLAQFIQSHY